MTLVELLVVLDFGRVTYLTITGTSVPTNLSRLPPGHCSRSRYTGEVARWRSGCQCPL